MSHVIALGDGWQLWRWSCLRAAGFPARRVLELARPELAADADRQLALDAEAARGRDHLIAACKAALDRVGPDDRRALARALKRLWQHRVPESIADPQAEAARAAYAEAAAARDAHTAGLQARYAEAHRATSAALRRLACDDRFRQALLWQNRSAVHTGLDWLLRQPIEAGNDETRKNERLVASYLQRYCVKNDTIGFFGPVGWARWVNQPRALVQQPGPTLLASRTVYFEYWAIDALTARLSQDPRLRPFLAPRLLPRFRLDGTTLHYPVERRTELPAELAAVAARCDGEQTARDLARALIEDPACELADEAGVFEGLDELVASGAVHWRLEIPTAGAHPEQYLAALLARIDDPEARDGARSALAELDEARASVAAASDAAQLDAALAAFETRFSHLTAADSRRAHGRTYAGRTPLYEDCRRDLALELGRPVLDRLAPALTLLLDSARWFTHQIATCYRRALGALYHRLCAGGDPVVDFARFWQDVPALFPGGAAPGSIVGDVRAELHRRWAAILTLDPAAPAIEREASALAGEVARAFAAPGPGWPAARHHSPDVMIATAGGDAVARGDYRLVIGELHTGFNTIVEPLFVRQHPHGDELIAARDADLDRVCIAPVWSKAVTRGDYYSLSPHDLDLETADTRSARPRSQVVAVSELVVEERAGRLEVRTRDGARRFDVIAFMEHHLIAESFAAFSPLAPAPHTPRVTIDDAVIARETWRIAPAELAWPALREPVERFVAARRWARSLGMPRWLFVKTAEEVKPVYVDLDSTVYVELLAKLLRGASAATLSEMLPAFDELWVTDADGARYTAELRIAAVDPVAWPERDG
jgi:hypothetical protein